MLPAPDGTITQADRQHTALHYSGILAAVSVPPIPLTIIPGSGVSGASDTSYFIKIYDPYGNAMPDTGALWRVEVAQGVGVVGSVTFSIPGDYDADFLRKDGLIEVWRAPRNRAPYLLFNKIFFLRRATKILSGGNRAWKCTAYDPNYLLSSPSGQRGRIVAYAATSAQAMKTDNADDMLKAIMRENVGALATDTARDLSAYLTIQADTSDGPIISKEFSNRVLVPVLNEICQASWTAGTYLAWDIVVTTPPHRGDFQLEFRTYINQRGKDHRASSPSRVLIGTEYGNLDDVEVDDDWTEEENYIRAGGQDNGTTRIYQSGGNATAMAESPFNRRETFVNIQNTASLTTLQNEIDWALKVGVPRPFYSGTLTAGGQESFDDDWGYGDFLTAQAENRAFDARVDGMTISFDRDTGEHIQVHLNGYNPSPGNPIEELGGNIPGSSKLGIASRAEIAARATIKSLRNSIARLQKHVQAQGRRHEFSRPYEVVGSGLVPGSGSGSAMIGIFNGPCPTGWTEYTAAQGRVIVGVPAGGTVAGTVGSALANLDTRDITTVVAHLHAFGTLAASSESAHTHGIGTYNAATEAAHTHAVGTLNAATESAHTHGAGTYDAAGEAAHTHADGTLVNSSESAHTHAINPPSAESNNESIGHTHTVDPGNTTTTSGGVHTHTSSPSNSGSHIAPLTGGASNVGGGGGTITEAAILSNAAAHTHDVNIASFASGGASVSHTHDVDIPSFTSAAGAGHAHTITGSTAAGTSHAHAISGTSAAGSVHDHVMSGSVAAGSSHDHALSGNSGAGSSHNHTLSGSVASTGAASVDVTMPYIQLRLCQKN